MDGANWDAQQMHAAEHVTHSQRAAVQKGLRHHKLSHRKTLE